MQTMQAHTLPMSFRSTPTFCPLSTFPEPCSCCFSRTETVKGPYPVQRNTVAFPAAHVGQNEIQAFPHYTSMANAVYSGYSHNESSSANYIPDMYYPAPMEQDMRSLPITDHRLSCSSPASSTDSCTYDRAPTPQPTDEETEIWLRKNLSIPEPLPLNLWSLPDDNPGVKPPKISDMIKLAIWSSRRRKLTLRQIYAAIEERYPSYKTQDDKPWQRSIRHNLSLKAMFVPVERPTGHPGKGHYWKLNVHMGDCTTRERKRMEENERLLQEQENYYQMSSYHHTGSQAPPDPQPLRRPDTIHRTNTYPLMSSVGASFNGYIPTPTSVVQSPSIQSCITHTRSFSGHMATVSGPSAEYTSPASRRNQPLIGNNLDSAVPFTSLSTPQPWPTVTGMYHQSHFSDIRTPSLVTPSLVDDGLPFAHGGYIAGTARPLARRTYSDAALEVEREGVRLCGMHNSIYNSNLNNRHI